VNDFPWLTVLWAVPLVGALATAFAPKGALAKQTALVASLLTLAVGIVTATQFDQDGSGFQLEEKHT
jgi:NADH-quinone oxidoreductase subunit M